MKRHVLITFLFACFLLGGCFYSRGQTKVARIWGSYYYSATDSLSGIKLDLNKNGTFFYTAGGDIESMHSLGKWILRKDTLVLNSSIDRNAIPISVKEQKADTLKDRMVISLQNSIDGEVVEAIIRLNSDTTTECIPLFGTGCDHKLGAIKNFRVDFNNGTYSKWYEVKNKMANLIKIIVNIKEITAMPIVNQRYLYRNGKLYNTPPIEVTELDRDGNLVKREIILEKQK